MDWLALGGLFGATDAIREESAALQNAYAARGLPHSAVALMGQQQFIQANWTMHDLPYSYGYYKRASSETVYRCGYCATMFTLEKSCGCGAKRA